jgi:hypothetical protein
LAWDTTFWPPRSKRLPKKAVKRKEVHEPHPKLKEWKELRKNLKKSGRGDEISTAFAELLGCYTTECGNTSYLRQRFVEFIFRYCPTSEWSLLPHPMENRDRSMQHMFGLPRNPFWRNKLPWDVYPEQIPEDVARELMSDAYKHRCNYTHEGQSPPHGQLDCSHWFFEVQLVPEGPQLTAIVLPTFRLLAFIAYRSILAYARNSLVRPDSMSSR